MSAYLDLAESRAMRHIPMTMEDWSNRLEEFLKLTDREILQDAGKISHKIACDKAESEIDRRKPKVERMLDFLSQVENPYVFKVNGPFSSNRLYK